MDNTPRMDDTYYATDRLRLRTYKLGDHWHREDGPAYMWYSLEPQNPQDTVLVEFPLIEIYYRYGARHREDGPAYQEYHQNRNLKAQTWCLHGIPHRENAPAHRLFTEHGTVRTEVWYSNGEIHRIDGPAYIKLREDGSIKWGRYYWKGKLMLKKDYQRCVAFHKMQENALRHMEVLI